MIAQLRGNRQWPCSECVRRGTAHLCPHATSSHGPSKAKQVEELQSRIKELERLLGQTMAPSQTETEPAIVVSACAPSLPNDPSPNTQDAPLTWPSPTANTIGSVGELKRKIGGNSRFFGVTVAEHRLAMTTANEEGAIQPNLSAGWPLKSTSDVELAELVACLPSRKEAQVSVERYWECTLWR